MFQNESKCKAIDMKMTFCSHANKTHFPLKGFALSLVLKVRVFRTQKWPLKFTLQEVIKTPGFKTCDEAKFG